MAPTQSPSYLTPLDASVNLESPLEAALHDLESQFDLPTEKLKEITEKMLWEYKKGLTEFPTEENKDTFWSVEIE